jgi:hypothetical protein
VESLNNLSVRNVLASSHTFVFNMMQNNIYGSFLHKVVLDDIARAHILAETLQCISVAQFLSTTQSSLQGLWLLNSVVINEVHWLHVTIRFVHSSRRRCC